MMSTNFENGDRTSSVNCTINNTSADESTLYYSMNNSAITAELENTIGEEEEALISVEIPDFSPNTMLPDPLAVCDKLLQKTNLMSSTPNRLPFQFSHDKVSPSGGTEKTAVADESKDDTLKEESVKDVSGKDYVSLKQILDDASGEKVEEKIEIVEIKEYNIVRVMEDLTKVVIEEESCEEEDNKDTETKKEEHCQEIIEEPSQEIAKQAALAEKIEIKEQIPPTEATPTKETEENKATEKDEEIPDKEENKENIKDNSEKKQRRRSKIAILANPPAKEPKVTGKPSLIRRSILKTDVKSPAKLTKTAQFNLTKRSSLLPKNFIAANKRQTIGSMSKVAAPAPSLAKPKQTTAKLNPPLPPPPPALKKRQTLAPATATASGSRTKSPKGILSTKNPTIVNKSPKFLHPKDVKVAPARDFECKVCRKKFRTSLVLEAHLKTHKEVSKAGNICKYCDRRFEIKQGLENHIQKYCTKIPVGEKRRLLQEEAKANALTPRTKRWIKAGGSSGADEANTSSASSSSDLMSMLRNSPVSNKRRSVAFAGISATPNRTIKCFQCHKEFVDVFEFSDHIAQHVTN